MLKPYTQETELQMQEFHSRLTEKNRRLYAGVEASKLPHGGIRYISTLFNCSRSTVLRGIEELEHEDTVGLHRDRKAGGGRVALVKKHPEIDVVFLDILKNHTAGDPMDEKVKWTDLTCAEISDFLDKQGFKASRNIV
ncbi:MAG: ISAzo13 family transposase, partial [Gammaproteobacteria bacterium]|nr:ISAzo13 family transposase [Gammaproteobacteria bacterium]